jgi:ATP-dependent exoDNAse (exonuclease V) beta subunit
MVSDREGEPVTVRTSMGLETDVQRIISEGVKHSTGTIAILCRSNAEVADVKAVFDNKGVPYTSNSKEDDYAQRCQKASEDNDFLVEWLSSKLNASDYSNYIRMCIVDGSFKSAEKFKELYGSNPYYPSIKQSLLDIEGKNYKLNNTFQQSNIYIGTVHSVKGLEFDEVLVMNVGAKSFRLKSEDMLNLYYVAVTRAKSKLTVFKVGD